MKSKIVKKRLLAVALAAAMMSSAVDYSCAMEVRAEESAEEQNLTVEETVEIDPEILEQLPDNDELFAGHVEQVLYGNDDASIYANYGEDKFEDLNLSIYRQLKVLVNKIANEGGTAVVAIPDDLDITWETEATGDTLKQEAREAFAIMWKKALRGS